MTDTATPPRLVGITSLSDAVVLASTLNAWLALYEDDEVSDETRAMANHLYHRLKARAEQIAETDARANDAFSASDNATATARGWCLIASGEGQMTIEARPLNRRFLTDTAAYDHVAAVAEAVGYADAAYQELCQRALCLTDDSAPHAFPN